MSAEFWSAYADASSVPPGTPEFDAAMGRADAALAAAERAAADEPDAGSAS